MPLQLTSGDRKILLIAAVVFVVMVGATLLLVRGTSAEDEIPTAYSTASGGCKAAYVLLQESGYQIRAWEQPMRDLPGGKGKTLIIVEPSTFPAQEEKQRLEEFLKSGGRVIAAGRFSGFYLPWTEAVRDPAGGTLWKRTPALALSPITRVAPEITLAARAYWRPSTGAVGLYGTTDKPVVIEYKFGEGEVLWLADTTPLTNAGVKEAGNLEFLLAAVGSPGQNEILWDEYVHGFEHSAASGASQRVIAWIFLQAAVFAGAILLTYSRRSGPVWIPEAEVRLSPLEFVRTLGWLYQQANAGGVAVEIFYQRFRYLLTRRLGLAVNCSIDDLARAVHRRWDVREEDFADTLRECETCRYDTGVTPAIALRLAQALFDYGQRFNLIRSQRAEKMEWKQS